MGWIFSQKLNQPKVLGELVAGMIIGPYVLGAIPISHLGPLFPLMEGTIPVSPELYGIATIGSIFLLFSSGLETDLPTFIRFSGKATVVGVGGVVFSFLLGAGVTVLLHNEVHSMMDPEALFLGYNLYSNINWDYRKDIRRNKENIYSRRCNNISSRCIRRCY